MWELVEARASASPEVAALIESDRELTFAELRDQAERVAAGLQDLGIGRGTRVTWQLPTRIETVVLSLALARLAAVQNPILPLYRDREVGFVVSQVQADVFCVPGDWNGFDFVAMAERIAEEHGVHPRVLVTYDDLPEGDPATLPPAPSDGDEVRWIYYTSGTTSAPKGVQHSDGTLMAGGLGLADALELTADDVGSIAFPYSHIAGPDYLMMLLYRGCGAVLIEAFALDAAVELFARKGATMAGGGPAFYQMYLSKQRSQPGEPIIPSLRLLSGGGAPKPPEMYTEVKNEMGIPVCHGYGMTECPMISQGGPDDSEHQLMYTDGHPVTGCQVRIVTLDGEVAGTDVDGEVRVKGPMVFKGYTDASLDADAFDDEGWFRTGDLGHLDDAGYVVLTGRLKDVIIRKGENISAKEIEDLLYQHPKVGDVAVIGLPDRDRGERVCAVVETAEGTDPLTFDEMVAYLAEADLMRQKVPEQLEVVDALPRNNTLGKILKTDLRDQFRDKPWP
ncbi:class I adenylate-forming enzyme family protein [Rhabdothermincola salaria]|uniref:class I adenylate-forming enzyme family protein n=1 Tax=Rhabdothermincola salaria TaxID=2903142 RepID=UPI002016B52E|nr:AMP-binding protein [Rhabdothermincola salaria]